MLSSDAMPAAALVLLCHGCTGGAHGQQRAYILTQQARLVTGEAWRTSQLLSLLLDRYSACMELGRLARLEMSVSLL